MRHYLNYDKSHMHGNRYTATYTYIFLIFNLSITVYIQLYINFRWCIYIYFNPFSYILIITVLNLSYDKCQVRSLVLMRYWVLYACINTFMHNPPTQIHKQGTLVTTMCFCFCVVNGIVIKWILFFQDYNWGLLLPKDSSSNKSSLQQIICHKRRNTSK